MFAQVVKPVIHAGFGLLLIERDPSRVRPRIFEPDIPDDITGEELEKSVRAELLSLSAENAKVVARHLACINLYMDVDPELAHKHGVAAAHHAGRLSRCSRERWIRSLSSRDIMKSRLKGTSCITSHFR